MHFCNGSSRPGSWLFGVRARNRFAFYLALSLNLVPLLAAKFVPLFQPDYPLLFIGLSYVTFRVLDVTIGIQDGLIKAVNPVAYLSFLLFFPTISSGPIDRYRRFEKDWNSDAGSPAILVGPGWRHPAHLHGFPV